MVYIIIALIIIAIILILLFSLRVLIDIELRDELKIRVWVLGKKITAFPPDEKKYKLSDYTPRKIEKRQKKLKKLKEKKEKNATKRKKLLGTRYPKKLTKEEKKAYKRKKREKRPSLSNLIGFIAEMLQLFFSTLFPHLRIKTSRIKIKVGGPDAAQVALRWYGIYAACDSLIGILDRYSHLCDKKNSDISIEPDYLSEKIDVDLKISFSINLFGILCVILKVLVKAVVGWLDIQPQSPATTTAKNKSQAKPKAKKI